MNDVLELNLVLEQSTSMWHMLFSW